MVAFVALRTNISNPVNDVELPALGFAAAPTPGVVAAPHGGKSRGNWGLHPSTLNSQSISIH